MECWNCLPILISADSLFGAFAKKLFLLDDRCSHYLQSFRSQEKVSFIQDLFGTGPFWVTLRVINEKKIG